MHNLASYTHARTHACIHTRAHTHIHTFFTQNYQKYHSEEKNINSILDHLIVHVVATFCYVYVSFVYIISLSHSSLQVVKCAKIIISHCALLLPLADHWGRTALHHAAAAVSSVVCTYVLTYVYLSAHTHHRVNKFSSTVVYAACMHKMEEHECL